MIDGTGLVNPIPSKRCIGQWLGQLNIDTSVADSLAYCRSLHMKGQPCCCVCLGRAGCLLVLAAGETPSPAHNISRFELPQSR